MRRFVVVGVQRSGTTLVTTSLDSHPSILCAGELFKMRQPRASVEVRDGGYRNYVKSALRLQLTDRVARRLLVRIYLDRFFAQPSFEAIGFKLMRNHLYPGQFPSVIPYLIQHQMRVIHVIRENVLKTHISRLMAQRSGLFHGTHQSSASGSIEVPIPDLLRRLRRIAEQNRDLAQIFAVSVPYLTCIYEKYKSNADTESSRLLGFLEMPDTKLQSPLVKLTSDDLSTTIENFDAVKQCLQGTEFEKWI